jgi:hypothetical protein
MLPRHKLAPFLTWRQKRAPIQQPKKMAPTSPGLILHMQALSCSTSMQLYLALKAQSEFPDEELCMPNILLVRSPFARTPKAGTK